MLWNQLFRWVLVWKDDDDDDDVNIDDDDLNKDIIIIVIIIFLLLTFIMHRARVQSGMNWKFGNQHWRRLVKNMQTKILGGAKGLKKW